MEKLCKYLLQQDRRSYTTADKFLITSEWILNYKTYSVQLNVFLLRLRFACHTIGEVQKQRKANKLWVTALGASLL